MMDRGLLLSYMENFAVKNSLGIDFVVFIC